MKGLRKKYEEHHHAIFTDDSLKAAVECSVRYLPDRFLPDKAIDLIVEAGAKARISSMHRPSEFKILEEKVAEFEKQKNEAIKEQKFEDAANYRDKERQTQQKLEEMVKQWRNKIDENKTVVDADDITTVVSMDGIPVSKMGEKEMERLLRIEDVVGSQVWSKNSCISFSKSIETLKSRFKRS